MVSRFASFNLFDLPLGPRAARFYSPRRESGDRTGDIH